MAVNLALVDLIKSIGWTELQSNNKTPEILGVNQCELHNKPLDAYCWSCLKEVCLDCILQNHRGNHEDKNFEATNKKAQLIAE